MGLLGPGVVVVNDSREAAKLQTRWLLDDFNKSRPLLPPSPTPEQEKRHRNALAAWKLEQGTLYGRIQEYMQLADKAASLEEHTTRDLKEAGLTVQVQSRYCQRHRSPVYDCDVGVSCIPDCDGPKAKIRWVNM